MRVAAVLMILLVGGLCAGIATADIGVPTLPSPTVTVPTLPPPPSLPVSVPTTPAPPPTPTPPVSVPSVSAPVPSPSVPPAVTNVTSAVGSSAGGAAGSAGGAAGGAGGAVGGATGGATGGGAGGLAGIGGSTSGAAGGGSGNAGGGSGSSSGAPAGNGQSTAQISRFHASRSFIAMKGPKERRRTIFIYRLRKGGRVVFTIRQVAPACAMIGSFVVRGHAGTNKTPFWGRVHGRQLSPGTYEVAARALRDGTVLRTTFVVVASGIPSPAAIAAARQENVCAARAA